jgi:hypothetical protein
MLMPFFPEEPGLREYNASLNGYAIRITADDPNIPIATPHDRKILNLLAGALAHNIRAGEAPTRHVVIDTRTLVETLSDGGAIGGSQYNLVLDRLKRLMSTVIETEMPLGDGIQRRRRFRWIDAFEHDDKDLPGGRKMLGLRITISEDAFDWMTRSLGFDISRREFHALTSYRSSIWRIYEICLVRLITHRGNTVHIPIDDLRIRIPIASQLKLFKSRTLKTALREIPENPEMSAHIRVELARKTSEGFEVIDFSQRARLDTLYVRVSRGSGPLPHLNTILAHSEGGAATEHGETSKMTG